MDKIIVKEINGFDICFHEEEPSFEEQDNHELIREWIKIHLTKSLNKKYTSYRIKHLCENDLGFYVSNADIKYNMAMLNIKGIQSRCCYNYYYPFKE